MQTVNPPAPEFLELSLPEKPHGIVRHCDGRQHEYRVEGPLGAGFRGVTQLGTCLDTQQRVVIKTPKIILNPSIGAMRHCAEEMRVDARKEIKATLNGRLGKIDCVAHVIDAISIYVPEIGEDVLCPVQEFVDGQPLHQYVLTRYPERSPLLDGETQFRGVPGYPEWWKLFRKIARCIGEVHRLRVCHSDIWPRNIMVRHDSSIVLIDFGSSWDLHEIPCRQDSGGRPHPYMAPQRRLGLIWRTEADIYSLGMVGLFLAIGNPPEAFDNPPADPDELKSLLLKHLNAVNPALPRQNLGIIDVIHRCLRQDTASRAASTNEVMDDLQLFAPDETPAVQSVSADELRNPIEAIQSTLSTFGAARRLSLEMVRHDVAALKERIAQAKTNLYELVGNREQLLGGVCRAIAKLDRGDMYAAVTMPALWSPKCLGLNGRFLTTNLCAALRGVAIKRVFAVTESELKQPAVRRVFEAQGAILKQIADRGIPSDDRDVEGPGCFIGYVVLSPAEKMRMTLDASNFSMIRIQRGYTSVAIDYQIDSKNPSIVERLTSVRFWQIDDDYQAQTQLGYFDKLIRQAKTLLPAGASLSSKASSRGRLT